MYDDEVDMEHYRRMMEDPSCTLEAVLMDWAHKDPIGAEWFTESHSTVPLTLDRSAVESFILDDMEPIDILFLGARSAGMVEGETEYFDYSEDEGILRALTESEVEEIFTENFRDLVLDDIVSGRIAPPDEIAGVVEMWRRRQKTFRPEHPPYQGRRARPAGRFVR